MSNSLTSLADAWEHHGLVLLAGAGVSIPPPTSLPGWRDFNDAVLSGLARRVERFTDAEIPADETLKGFRVLRDERGALPPDFQAQLMEEECGEEYFRVLQVLDSDQRNPCHDAIAALARTGVVAAIVTTNFDQLIERALAAAGVAYRLIATPDDFESLSDTLDAAGPLAVIKPHGSVQWPASMVDTLRQRVKGRPELSNTRWQKSLRATRVWWWASRVPIWLTTLSTWVSKPGWCARPRSRY